MAAETNQISPPSPSSSPAPFPSSAASGPASSPEAPRDDPPEQEAAPEDPQPEDEESEDEEDGEGQHEAKRQRVNGPAALTKLVSFSFDVRSNAGTPETTPRFGSDAFLSRETKEDVWATGGAAADRGEEQKQDEGEEEGRSEE